MTNEEIERIDRVVTEIGEALGRRMYADHMTSLPDHMPRPAFDRLVVGQQAVWFRRGKVAIIRHLSDITR